MIGSFIKDNITWVAPLFVTFFFSVVNIIFTWINVVMVNKQSKLQNDSFCFQLYEKRMRVYDNFKSIVMRIIQTDVVTNIDLNQMVIETKECTFLFGEDVNSITENIYLCASQLHMVKEKQKKVDDSRIADLLAEETLLIKQIKEYNVQLTDSIKKYVSFSNFNISNR